MEFCFLLSATGHTIAAVAVGTLRLGSTEVYMPKRLYHSMLKFPIL